MAAELGVAASTPAPVVHERLLVPALVVIGLVVSVVSSLGAPLIPTIAADLGVSLGAAQWSLTATLLVGAVFSPLVGRLGDGPRRREVLVGCLAVVTVGGAVAALAGSLAVLVTGRALQGLGLALMPLTMAVARDHLPADRAGSAIATLSVVAAVGVGLGYPITGVLADSDPAAAFWFGTAASAVALGAALTLVPRPAAALRPGALDLRGAALVGGGVLALLLALEQGERWGWTSAATGGLILAAVVLLTWWVRHELRVTDPLVELRLVRHPAVLTADVTGLVLGVAMYLGISLVTQVVQLPAELDQSVLVAGLTLVPLSVGSMASSLLHPAAGRRLGARATLPLGALVIAAAMAFFAVTGDALWQAFLAMGLVGLGLGFTFAALPSLIVGAVPAGETSSAMSFYQVSRYVGFSIGSGLAVVLLRVFDGAYGAVFGCGAAMCVLAAAVAWWVPGSQNARRHTGDR